MRVGGLCLQGRDEMRRFAETGRALVSERVREPRSHIDVWIDRARW